MKAFATLYEAIDASTSTHAKVAALTRYFAAAPPGDSAWAVAFLIGRRPKRLVRAPDLRTWAAAAADIPDWLFEDSYAQAGDLAETITLLVPRGVAIADASLRTWVEDRLLPLASMDAAAQQTALREAWHQLDGTARFVFNKLLTGAFRVGVSQGLVVRALAAASGVHADIIAHRLMGTWEPTGEWFEQLVRGNTADADWSRPYPFFLAHPLEGPVEALGDVLDWQVEWKWDYHWCSGLSQRLIYSQQPELPQAVDPTTRPQCLLTLVGTTCSSRGLSSRPRLPQSAHRPRTGCWPWGSPTRCRSSSSMTGATPVD